MPSIYGQNNIQVLGIKDRISPTSWSTFKNILKRKTHWQLCCVHLLVDTNSVKLIVFKLIDIVKLTC